MGLSELALGAKFDNEIAGLRYATYLTKLLNVVLKC